MKEREKEREDESKMRQRETFMLMYDSPREQIWHLGGTERCPGQTASEEFWDPRGIDSYWRKKNDFEAIFTQKLLISQIIMIKWQVTQWIKCEILKI